MKPLLRAGPSSLLATTRGRAAPNVIKLMHHLHLLRIKIGSKSRKMKWIKSTVCEMLWQREIRGPWEPSGGTFPLGRLDDLPKEVIPIIMGWWKWQQPGIELLFINGVPGPMPHSECTLSYVICAIGLWHLHPHFTDWKTEHKRDQAVAVAIRAEWVCDFMVYLLCLVWQTLVMILCCLIR